MKVKEIDRTANIAWSPASHHPIYLAAGTAAQQLDATFSTTAALEIYALNLTEPGLDMCIKGSVVSDFRFHKIVWGCEGLKEGGGGVIVGGADGGNVLIYDAAELIRGNAPPLLHHLHKHSGPVHSLDFNRFQECLLASGASESEIFIWDLNNPVSPVTLGAKSQPPEDVTCVAWNCQVQHILASTFPARCVVWDLRKNEPIIKVSDSSSRLRCKVVAWHPEVATQLCLASEDDHSPLIQLWDLRFATSPLKTMEHHQRGVLSIAWCPQDPDLLLSCGKDNRILVWNPNSTAENGEVLCDLPCGNQWSFDVAWCPRNPAIIANASCDGHVGVYSLMGGQQQQQCSSKIAESFPGSEKLVQPPNVESIHRHISVPLQKPPKWVRKPVGASFGFGGRLVFFGDRALDQAEGRCVHITQVVTEPELLKKSERLECALTNGNLLEFCQSKVDNCSDPHESITWNFLQATLSDSPRTKMLTLLGYDYEKVVAEINNTLNAKGGSVLDRVDLSETMSNLSTCDPSYVGDGSLAFESIAMSEKEKEGPIVIHTDPSDVEGLVSRALLVGNIACAVEVCVQEERWADALLLSQAGGLALLQKTQRLYLKSLDSHASKLMSAIVTSDWVSMVKSCDVGCWKEVLSAILTYAKPEDFPTLCELLGSRLEADPRLRRNASLCYISAGNMELLAQAWTQDTEGGQDVDSLQCLIEQIMVLRKAVERLSGSPPPLQTATSLSTLLGRYAELLATQGSLNSALTYLVDPNERTLSILRDRIYQALGHRSPLFPFQRVDVRRSSNAQQPPHPSSVGQPRKQPTYAYHHPTTSQPQGFSSFGNGVSSGNFTYSSVQTPYPTPPHSTPGSTHVAPPPNATPPPPPTEGGTNAKGSVALGSHRYPRHLHDPSVYSENPHPAYYHHQPPSFHPPQQPEMLPPQQPNFYSPPPDVSGNTHALAYPNSSVPPATHPYASYMPSSQTGTVPLHSNQPLPSCYSDVKPGWNDPPLLKQSQAKPQNARFEPVSPIVTPFPDVPSSQPLPPVSQVGPMNPGGGYFAPSFSPQQPPLAPASNVPRPLPNQTLVEDVKRFPQQPSGVDQVKEKGPIPPEHQVLQDIFEDLRRQCQQVATNPQMRRKLDDVAKKLENLYDKLREAALSHSVTHGLHQIVQSIMQGDYASALSVHGQLVQNANFSEIGGFMPSIKVLLQTAAQLNVFLQ